ncbi:MAG TPA: hypothetical protein VJP76_02310 [Candidatus Tumulicola sp.]|nr:hypothetical protein [Candidatus Tumulicola sp.]
MRKASLTVLALVLLLPALAAPAAAQCKLHRGVKVVLYSDSDDPDVLVWDSRFRLRDYSAASFDVAQQLLPHARLAPPGTRATVESCVPDFVTARLLSIPDDAVGVVITTGPLRDQRGWVIGSDVRARHAP